MNLNHVAEIELIYKSHGLASERPKINNAEDAYNILMSHWDENKLDFIEEAKILLLNRSGRVLGISNISTGGITNTIIDSRLVFVTALKANATSIIIAHNHPSANLQPSQADQAITKRLMDAGKLLEINVLDHIIATSEGYYSFAEQLAFEKVDRSGAIYFEAKQPF